MMIINNRKDLESLPKDEQEAFKQKLSTSINGWQWDGEWNLTQNTATIEQFGFTAADFPDAPVPPKPTNDPDADAADRKTAELEENRKNAYIAESDPLFFRSQRGEATIEEWQDKVAEIKQRFPK